MLPLPATCPSWQIRAVRFHVPGKKTGKNCNQADHLGEDPEVLYRQQNVYQ
jgi:hypothetical protein